MPNSIFSCQANLNKAKSLEFGIKKDNLATRPGIPGPVRLCRRSQFFHIQVPGPQIKVLYSFWHERPTLNVTSQLKIRINQWVTVDPTNLCTRCARAHLCVGRKCSKCTVRCCSAVAAGVFYYHLHQDYRVGTSHPSIVSNVYIKVSWNNRKLVSFNPSQGITTVLLRIPGILHLSLGRMPASNTGSISNASSSACTPYHP